MNALVLQPRDLVPVEALSERLARVTTVPDATAVADLAAACLEWAKRAHLGLDVSNHYVAIRTEAEARTGELLREMRERGLLARRGGDRRSKAGRGRLILDDLVGRHLGPIYEQVAAIPADVRAAYVAQATVARQEATRAGLFAYAARVRMPAPIEDELFVLPDEAASFVKRGDLFQLGQHRVLAGDATSAADVARLLGGAQPTLLPTDPPYGVRLDGAWRDGALGPNRPALPHARTNGHRTTSFPGDSRADWSDAFALVPSLEVGYIWHAGVHAAQVAEGLERIGFEVVQQVIWDKLRFAIGRGWYHWGHEPCWVVRKPKASVGFLGERNQSTIWRAPSPKMVTAGSDEAKFDHHAQKPMVLFERPIANHLRPGESLYDPFVGSGTSVIAAERLGCQAFAMDIEPRFVELTIRRWEAYTGQTAVRL